MADARRSQNLAAGGLLLVLAAALLLWQRPWQSTTPDDVVPIPADAAVLLADQFRALSDATSQQAFVSAAGSGARARTFATDAWKARQDLDVSDVKLRYLRGGQVADRADGSTSAEVAVSWRAGQDSAVSGTTVRDAKVEFRVDPRRDGTLAIRSASTSDTSLPLWLAGRIRIDRGSGFQVIGVDGGVPDLDVAAKARVASERVRKVVPDVRGVLTLISPRTRALTADLVGRSERQVAEIAAITTTVDGGTRSAPVVVLNPAQFATMDSRAAQVVISHEATHLLTGAIGTGSEAWVVEGFADFVALHDDTAPLAVSAGQALRQVKEKGLPKSLPTANDFGRGDHALGAVYESTWMVFRMLGERYDDRTIARFYSDVLSGSSTEAATRRAFDLSVKQLTDQWRDYLTKSASTVS